MCENIIEKSATVKKELIPTTVIKLATAVTTKPAAVACGKSNSDGSFGIGRSTVGGCSAALSLFDQLKNSVSHNLTVTDRITNNKNGHKVKTLLSHHDQETQQHSTNNNNSNKTQIYHGRSLLKPLAANHQKEQQQQQELNANDANEMTEDEAEYEEEDETEEEEEEEEEDIEEPPDILNEKLKLQNFDYQNINNNHNKINSHQLNTTFDTTSINYAKQRDDDDVEEFNDSSASSISATTAPLQIALDSTSSHSSNSNNSFTEYCEKTNATTATTTSSFMSDKSKKLSTICDLKEKCEQHTATIACQTLPLSFLSNSSTTSIADVTKTTIITSTSLNTTNNKVGNNFFTTDVGKTVMDGGEYLKKTAGEQQQISTSLLLPQTVSPLLGIVHGTKRATLQQYQQQQPVHKKQNTRSVASTNSLAQSSVSIPSFIDMQQQQQQQQQISIEQQHQVSNINNSPMHFQRNQHKTTCINPTNHNNNNNTKKTQKSVLDFGRLENTNCNRSDNKRKRCNDRYDSSESSDR